MAAASRPMNRLVTHGRELRPNIYSTVAAPTSVAGLRAVEVRSSHQFEEEIGAASSEKGLFIAKIEFSVRTTPNNANNA